MRFSLGRRLCIGGRCHVIQPAMWSRGVVVVSPVIDELTSLVDRSEPVLIQTAIPEFAIEAFHKGILSWFPRLDKTQFYVVVLGPEEQRF